MSEDFKKALAAIALSPLILILFGFLWVDANREHQAEKQAEEAAFEALTPEQKLRQKIKGITEYRIGETIDGLAALQLTAQHDLIGIRSTKNELLHRAAQDIKTGYQYHAQIQTLDIQYEVKLVNSYGETSYSPALYIEIDRTNFQRIQWQNFRPENLDQIATVQELFPL